jgi:hypothetical protein
MTTRFESMVSAVVKGDSKRDVGASTDSIMREITAALTAIVQRHQLDASGDQSDRVDVVNNSVKQVEKHKHRASTKK